DAVEAMLEVIHESRRHVGIKPSGGIKNLADAARYLEVADRIMGRDWIGPSTFRFGASGLLDGILDELS
ncbi:MAG: deoxyribose-phosphate aldolase, partial [Actinomycetota bacterium]